MKRSAFGILSAAVLLMFALSAPVYAGGSGGYCDKDKGPPHTNYVKIFKKKLKGLKGQFHYLSQKFGNGDSKKFGKSEPKSYSLDLNDFRVAKNDKGRRSR